MRELLATTVSGEFRGAAPLRILVTIGKYWEYKEDYGLFLGVYKLSEN